ncbi:hypothetical protein [Flavobacterium rhizosphaerae]|uniref:DUF4252 domain-containing protein n=1 Tax=Flavobacterium rhizosphaerae TaxID=3163298 RepID=A0ABW8YXR6_9FLAO
MKTCIVTLLILFQGLFAGAQTFGATGLDVQGNFDATKPIYRQWLKLANKPDVTYKFQLTPEGLNDAMKLTERILIENGLDIDNPDIYKSIEADNIKGSDPQVLHKAIQSDKARVNLAWYSPDGSTLHLFLGKYSYEVNVLKAYKAN